jgi:hypothetical protein
LVEHDPSPLRQMAYWYASQSRVEISADILRGVP